MREKLLNTFRETFPEANFEYKDFESLEINSVSEWDSMGNLN